MKALTSLRTGTARVTIYDVAKAAGVSSATVSRYLNGRSVLADKTKERVAAAISELGYLPNSIARSLATRSTQTVALLLPDITNPFFPSLVKGVQMRADERDYTVILGHTGGDQEREQRYLDVLARKQIDGVLLVGLELKAGRLAEFTRYGIPVVCLDRTASVPGASAVQVDNRAGARKAVGHLLELGHRSIAHIAGEEGLRVSRDRARGYRDALERFNVPFDPHLIVPGDFTEAAGYSGVDRLVESGADFTALFAANDLMAIGAMARLNERGQSIPRDISVVGFDDVDLALYTTPRLTTIHQPAFEMGRRAAEILVDAIEGNGRRAAARVVFDPELIVRESTAPPRKVR